MPSTWPLQAAALPPVGAPSSQPQDLRDQVVVQVLPALIQRADDLDIVSRATFHGQVVRQAFDLAEAVLQERARRDARAGGRS